jgi:hypothetical protein
MCGWDVHLSGRYITVRRTSERDVRAASRGADVNQEERPALQRGKGKAK